MRLGRHQLLAAAAILSLAAATAASAQTATPPRTAAGKPNLSGLWGGPGAQDIDDIKAGVAATLSGAPDLFPSRRCSPVQIDCTPQTNQALDQEFTGRADANRPIYKPEFWDKVQYLDMNTNKEDPLFACQSYGLPRVGPPARIIQTDDDVVFLYWSFGATTQPADYRVIPTDGREHDALRAIDVTFYGDSVGKWEGDTLVIDTVGFNDETWLARGGYFHSDQMRITERVRRDGNTLVYDVTVDDPQVLVEPWKMTTIRTPLIVNKNAYLPEAQPCKDYDLENMTSQIRH